jgi:hypothetical protein
VGLDQIGSVVRFGECCNMAMNIHNPYNGNFFQQQAAMNVS